MTGTAFWHPTGVFGTYTVTTAPSKATRREKILS
jgi:hypothetical protein